MTPDTALRRTAEAVDGDRRNWPVLKDAPLRPGFDRRDLSRYGDERWDLNPAVFHGNAGRSRSKAQFGEIADPTVEEAMRAFLYARLNIHIAGWATPMPPAQLQPTFHEVRPFLEFVASELGAYVPARIDQALLNRYAEAQFAIRRTAALRARYLAPVWHLFHYRAHLNGHGLPFEPWSGRSTASLCGTPSDYGENRTPRLPEAILKPLLAWSFKYVRVFSVDILAARAEASALQSRSEQMVLADQALPRRDRSALRAGRVRQWLDHRAKAGRGVPVWTQQVNRHTGGGPNAVPINWKLINTIAGVDAVKEPETHVGLRPSTKVLVDRYVRERGTEPGGFDTPISIDPDTGRPWRQGFDLASLKREERMLQAASYVICAYLTGMRDSEIQAMRFGCLDVVRSEDGVIERHRVRSTAYKGKRKQGAPADWITIEPVAQAIAILERLSRDAADAYGVDTLWPVLNQAKASKPYISAEIVRQLNEFRDHANRLADGDPARVIPTEHDGRPFRITTRQFRRTLAWYIANRPFGTIAGMIQYKHASSAMFEGYAGSSPSGFSVQIDQERRAGQLEDVLEYFEARRIGDEFSGPAKTRIGAILDEAARDLAPLPARLADRSRIAAMLGGLAKTLHVGVLADCFFDPVTALCLRRETSQSSPRMAMCQPSRCPNACIRKKHLPAWDRAAENARLHLRNKRLSKPQRIALRADLDRVEATIANATG